MLTDTALEELEQHFAAAEPTEVLLELVVVKHAGDVCVGADLSGEGGVLHLGLELVGLCLLSPTSLVPLGELNILDAFRLGGRPVEIPFLLLSLASSGLRTVPRFGRALTLDVPDLRDS